GEIPLYSCNHAYVSPRRRQQLSCDSVRPKFLLDGPHHTQAWHSWAELVTLRPAACGHGGNCPQHAMGTSHTKSTGGGSMHHKLVRTIAFGGIMALGLGSAQAALASTAQIQVDVPCDTPALVSALSNATSGQVLVLAPGC